MGAGGKKGTRKMTRLTSREVWQQIKDEGLLSKMQLKALQVFVWYGHPMTGSELNDKTSSKNMHKRISELFTAGVLRQAGRKLCSITKRSVMAWEATGIKPHQTLKAIGNERRGDAIKRLRAQVKQLEATNDFLRAELESMARKIETLTRELTKAKGTVEADRLQGRLF